MIIINYHTVSTRTEFAQFAFMIQIAKVTGHRKNRMPPPNCIHIKHLQAHIYVDDDLFRGVYQYGSLFVNVFLVSNWLGKARLLCKTLTSNA